jgi:hypothetical protein
MRLWTRERDVSSWKEGIKKRNRDEDKEYIDWEWTVHSAKFVTEGKERKFVCARKCTKQVLDGDRHGSVSRWSSYGN